MSRHGAGSQTIRINVDSTTYIIEELRSPTPEPFPLDSPLVTSVMLSSWLLWGIYLAFRASVLLHDHYDSSTKYYAWLLLLAEVFALLSPFLSKLDLSLYVLYGDKSRRRPKLCLVGDAAPTVDIFVTCCGEDVELVMDTVAAAASQDYPPHRYRVFVLDDKGSLPLKRAIEEYRSHAASASPGPQIYYLCRKRTQQASDNFKAGNLQFGLQESAHLSYQSQFVAGLDADAIAERDWLRKSVPHLLLDAKLALINSAQRSYNIAEDDIFEPGSAAQSDWTDAARDNIGAMSCYGSGYVMRRSSLNKIGGWPQVGLGEDIMCGWTLAGHGWKIASCPEHLLSDLAPWSMDAMIRQRDRWMDGDLNLAKRFRFFLPGMDPLTGRTSAQRLSSIIISIRLLTSVTDALFPLMGSILFFTCQVQDVLSDRTPHEYATLKFIYLISFLTDNLSNFYLLRKPFGLTSSDLWLSPFKATRVARLCWSSVLPAFQPTGTIISRVNERDDSERLPLRRRMLTSPAMISAFYMILALLPLLSFSTRQIRGSSCHHPVIPLYATGVLVWLLECVFKYSLPLRYMVWPPTIPRRSHLVEKDKFGVARPKKLSLPSHKVNTGFPWLNAFQLILICIADWSQAPSTLGF